MFPITKNNSIQFYIEQNKKLIKTLVLKSNYAATAMNQDLISRYGESSVDPNDKKTWRYYKNIAGEYHDSDVKMFVVSLDTQETILFSKENLEIHTATAEGYQYGTRYHIALVKQFPKQEFLIHCIANPTAQEKAIFAQEGEILSFQQDLVEPWESTLIQDLGLFIKKFIGRWNVEAFSFSDPYYPVVFRAVLALQLLPKLLNLRLGRCKTSEVHSFHLGCYLASHGGLDYWVPYLTREQSLWLYRNINYLRKHVGSTKIFKEVIYNILDKRKIPLNELSVRQLNTFDVDGYPLLAVKRKQITETPSSFQNSQFDLSLVFDKEANSAVGNKRFFELSEENIVHKIKTGYSSVLQTKDLESYVEDISNNNQDSLENVLLRQLFSMSAFDLYNPVVNFLDTKTLETQSLQVKEIIVYMCYLAFKISGFEPVKMPDFSIVKFKIPGRTNLKKLLSYIPKKYNWLNLVVSELVRNTPDVSSCFSVSSFFKLSQKLYLECLRQKKALDGIEDVIAKGILETAILKMYGSMIFKPENDEFVLDWFSRNKIPFVSRTREESLSLFKELFEKSTGYRTNETKKIKNIQKKLIELVRVLTSYSINFLSGDVEKNFYSLEDTTLRLTNPESKISNQLIAKTDFLLEHRATENQDCIFSLNHNQEVISALLTKSPNIQFSIEESETYYTDRRMRHTNSFTKHDDFMVSTVIFETNGSRILKENNFNLNQTELKALKFIGNKT